MRAAGLGDIGAEDDSAADQTIARQLGPPDRRPVGRLSSFGKGEVETAIAGEIRIERDVEIAAILLAQGIIGEPVEERPEPAVRAQDAQTVIFLDDQDVAAGKECQRPGRAQRRGKALKVDRIARRHLDPVDRDGSLPRGLPRREPAIGQRRRHRRSRQNPHRTLPRCASYHDPPPRSSVGRRKPCAGTGVARLGGAVTGAMAMRVGCTACPLCARATRVRLRRDPVAA